MQNLLKKLSLFLLLILSTNFMYAISPPDWVHFITIGPVDIEANCATVAGAVQYQFTLYSDVAPPQVIISSIPLATFPYIASDDYIVEARTIDNTGAISTAAPPVEVVTITTVYLDKIDKLCNSGETVEVRPEFDLPDIATTGYFSTDLMNGTDISNILTSSVIGYTIPFFSEDYYERCCMCNSLTSAPQKKFGSTIYSVYDPMKMEDLCNIAFYNINFTHNINYYSSYLDPQNANMNTTGGTYVPWDFDKTGIIDPCRFVDFTNNDFYTKARLANPNPLPETLEELVQSRDEKMIDAIKQVCITDMTGKQIKIISTDILNQLTTFKNNINQDASISSGLYLIKIETTVDTKTYKLMFTK